MARLRANGTPDPHFSANGRRTTTFTGNDAPHRVVSLGNGRILVAGSAGGAFGLVAYQHDGTPRPLASAPTARWSPTCRPAPTGSSTCGSSRTARSWPRASPATSSRWSATRGRLAGPVLRRPAAWCSPPTASPGTPNTVRLQPDGKLLAAGDGRPGADGDRQYSGVAVRRRRLPRRDLRRRWAAWPRASTSPTRSSRAYALLVEPEGRILVAGDSSEAWADYSLLLPGPIPPRRHPRPVLRRHGGIPVDDEGDEYYAQILSLAAAGRRQDRRGRLDRPR